MLVTLKRGTAANDLTAFVRDVKFIPGVGAARALQIFNGGRLEVSIPEDKT
jgi:hypothetical protein